MDVISLLVRWGHGEADARVYHHAMVAEGRAGRWSWAQLQIGWEALAELARLGALGLAIELVPGQRWRLGLAREGTWRRAWSVPLAALADPDELQRRWGARGAPLLTQLEPDPAVRAALRGRGLVEALRGWRGARARALAGELRAADPELSIGAAVEAAEAPPVGAAGELPAVLAALGIKLPPLLAYGAVAPVALEEAVDALRDPARRPGALAALRQAGEEGEARLVAALRGGSEAARCGAAAALAELDAGCQIEALIEALADPATLEAAAVALGQLGDPYAAEPLLAALRAGCLPAAAALAALEDETAQTGLRRALADGELSDAVRGAAARALASPPDGRALPALLKLAVAGDVGPLARAGALAGLAPLGDRRALRPVLAALEAGDEQELPAALAALRGLIPSLEGDELAQAVDAGARWLEAASAPTTAAAALALAEAPLAALRARLEAGRGPATRAALLGCLAASGDEEALEPLVAGLQDELVEVRREAAEGLVALAEQARERGGWREGMGCAQLAALPALLEPALGDAEPAVRRAATRALAALGAVEALPALTRALTDPECAEAAVDGLVALEAEAPERAAAAMLAVADDTADPRLLAPIRRGVAALGPAAARVATDVLESFARGEREGEGVRLAALLAEAVPAEVAGALLTSPDPELREAGLAAHVEAGGDPQVAAADPDPDVRAAVSEWLDEA